MGLSEAVARVNSPQGPVHLFHDIKINCKCIGQAIKHSQSQACSSLSPTLSNNEDNSSRAPSLSSQDSIQFRAAPSQALKCCMRNQPHVVKHISKCLHILANSDSEELPIIIDSHSASSGSLMSISPILAGPSMKYLYNQPISVQASSTDSLPTVSDLLEMKLSSATASIDSPISTITPFSDLRTPEYRLKCLIPNAPKFGGPKWDVFRDLYHTFFQKAHFWGILVQNLNKT